jgi:uncharacterized protein
MKQKKYLNPYLAGVILGVALLAAYLLAGRGLGASSVPMRTVVAIEKAISPAHVDATPYLAKYGGGSKNPFDNWLVFEVIGVLLGSFASAFFGGRIKGETNHGPQINDKTRWIAAVGGGILFGYGARLARGCSSGVALSGGATMAFGSWITMIAIFTGAFLFALIIKKLWV